MDFKTANTQYTPFYPFKGQNESSLKYAKDTSKFFNQNGLKWPTNDHLVKYFNNEVEELNEAIQDGNKAAIMEEWGDVAYTLADLSRVYNFNPDNALKMSTDKIVERYNMLKEVSPVPIDELNFDQRLEYWDKVKNIQKSKRNLPDGKGKKLNIVY